ncbi:interferon-induced protein 44-like [Scomber scombrus]|uniref:Interferon-induced protein 44-like n=1 Tax=Scomber scombrus TaxID=13677 RepID=A0AAV1QMC6_SCOSC
MRLFIQLVFVSLQHLNNKAMGDLESKPAPPSYSPPPTPPPPSPTFREPWRKISWSNKEEDMKYVKNYQPGNPEVKHLRIMLYGPVGAGKSSFISSVNNIIIDRQGFSTTDGDASFTTKYETHRIQKGGRGDFYPFVFNDIMGLEDNGGVTVEDIKLALQGHVRDGYTFNNRSALSDTDPGYNSSPSVDDRVHLLVCVYSANTSEIKESVLQKMKEIREAASDLGIPQVAIITKVDEACEETEKDLKNVYKSKYLKKKMTDFSSQLGIPLNCIFPVKNYSSEINIDDDVDSLILSALRRMIDFGDDFINKM